MRTRSVSWMMSVAGVVAAGAVVLLWSGEAAAWAGSPMTLGFWAPTTVVQPPAEPAQPPPAEPASEPAPPEDPTSDPAVERIIDDLERATAPRRSVEPVSPPLAIPARPAPITGVRPLDRRAGAAGKGRVVPEGTFLPSRRGRMSRSEAGEWVFHFDGDTSGVTAPPMVLLPCQTLMAMEGHAERGGESAELLVSGQVFVYHGRNYLLPTVFRAVRRGEMRDVRPLQ